MKKIITILLPLLALTACAGSPARISMMSPEDLKFESNNALCRGYSFSKSDKLKMVIKDRNLFTENDWALIENGQIRIGMSEEGLICSWGLPLSGVNKSVGSWGVRKQYVYGMNSRRPYVYVQDGKISSWQD